VREVRGVTPCAGGSPVLIARVLRTVEFEEAITCLYMPLRIERSRDIAEGVGDRLLPFLGLADIAEKDCDLTFGRKKYAYITVRRDLVMPGWHQNRPGAHVDGFLTDDVNYTYTVGECTKWIDVPVRPAPANHAAALRVFEHWRDRYERQSRPCLMQSGHLWRLDTTVHWSPTITEAHVRLFVKFSFSDSRFNLKGNAHNHLLGYDWEMFDRAEVRNHPTASESDSYVPGEPK
jgi:hypothetical protein